jgi:hypothetical protein
LEALYELDQGGRRVYDSTIDISIFDIRDLEARIMTFTQNGISALRTRFIGLVLAMSMTFCAGAVLVEATNARGGGLAAADTAGQFAGTWHWMFHGQSFATMNLVRSGAGFSGSVTGSRIALNDDGELRMADPAEDSAPKPIKKAVLDGSVLHITVADGFEFDVTLKDSTHAEIRPKGAPANMKPIPAEKVR